VSKESITDLIAKLRKLEQRERVDHREHGPECMGAPSWETRLSRDLALVVDALEAVTVPTENERELAFRIADTLAYYRCRLNNPKADHPHMGYHAFSEDQREHLRAQQAEATGEILRIIAENSPRLPVPVEPEWEYRRRHNRGANSATFDTAPELNHGEWVERRMLGEWEALEPDEVTTEAPSE
jgi:hypothetical protein